MILVTFYLDMQAIYIVIDISRSVYVVNCFRQDIQVPKEINGSIHVITDFKSENYKNCKQA